jgi:thioredoxin 2
VTTKTDSSIELRCPFCLSLNQVDLARAESRPKCGECAKPFLLDRPVRVDEADFDRTVLGAGPDVLVDFYADWCAPCKIVAPFLDNLAEERQGAILIAKVDTDRNPGLAARYSIRGIPTLILFRDGEEANRSVGYEPERLRAMAGAEEVGS